MRMGVVDVLDDDIRFVSANATVVEHLRPATGDPRGRCARDLGVPEDHIAAWIRHLRESERTGLPIRFEMRAGPVGEGLWFSNTVRFITRDADGTPRFSFISEDITERKRTEEALIEWKGRYEAAIQARGEILYDYDVTTGEMTYGGTFEEVLGYSAEDLVDGLARWIELIHPEDRAAFDKESRHALDTRGPFSLEYRVRCRDGSSIVVQDDGRLFTDATGAPTRVIGFIADITERKRAEDGLRRRNRELAALNAIAAAIGNSLRLPDVLATLERSLAEYLDIRGGALYLYAGAGTPIARYAGWGVPDPVQAHVEVLLRAGGPRTPAALTAGEPEPSSREGGGPFLTLTLDDAPPPWRYGLCLPLASEVGSQGVLTLFTADPPANDDDHVAFFELLGRQVGAALRNARLYEQVRRGAGVWPPCRGA